ncbi:MAG: DNA-3-methyladenine glycosylase [Acidimicrobiia bacterium]
MARLTRAFYDRDPRELAPDLLNKVLVSTADGVRLSARIVEVEAYRGSADPASHAYRGRTPRNATMFGPPGKLYVYFVYGMHYCANVVAAAPAGDAGAVLLRAAVPLTGLDVMRARRPAAVRDRDLCAGPARLALAFGLDRAHDGVDLVRGPFAVFDDGVAPPRRPARSARVGLRPGRGDTERWRWYVPDVPEVSGPRAR